MRGRSVDDRRAMISLRPRHAQRPRPYREADSGTIAVVAALAFVALIGMAALVVDGGYLATRRRSMQGVADAAALAGAFSLPTSATAISQARANATENGYTNAVNGVTVTVNSPYSSDARRIEVIVQTNVPTFLGKALKINAGVVRGRAVGKIDPAAAAVFAGQTACAGQVSGVDMYINGTGNIITGTIHSNGSLMMGGDATDQYSAVEYGSACGLPQMNGPMQIASGPTGTSSQPYPFSYTAASFPCTFTGPLNATFDVTQAGNWQSGDAWSGGGVMKPGVYCANGAGAGMLIGGNSASGNVTFVASGPIQVNGNVLNYTAFSNNILVYSSSAANNAVQLGNQNLTFTGSIFAPNGVVLMNGQNHVINGSIVGNNVALNATNFTINSGPGGTGIPYLSE